MLFMYHSVEYTRRMPRPRFIKTHLPISALPKDLLSKCKVGELNFLRDFKYLTKNVKFLALSKRSKWHSLVRPLVVAQVVITSDYGSRGPGFDSDLHSFVKHKILD